MANGQRIVGRSFKYHRPRGIVASGGEEPNALVNLGQGDRTSRTSAPRRRSCSTG
jgi:sarcosine oxidase subunit alpha